MIIRALSARLLLLLAIGPVVLLGGCGGQRLGGPPPVPEAYVAGIRVRRLTPDELQGDVLVELTNPLGVALPIGPVRYEIESGGRTIAARDEQPGRSAPAAQVTTVPLPIALRFDDVLAALPAARRGDEIDYRLTGTLVAGAPGVGRYELALVHAGGLPVPVAPEVRVARVVWQSLSFQRAEGLVVVRLDNPNAFDLDVRSIRGDLALDGVPVLRATVPVRRRLRPGETTTVEIPLDLEPVRLGLAAYRVLEGDRARARLRGVVRAETRWGELEAPLDGAGDVPLIR